MTTFDLKNFQFKKNYCIEASAGTGKTYNIIEIVKKLTKDNNVSLNKILIVTYTEKACGELQNRIRSLSDQKSEIYTIHSFCESIIHEFGISAGLPLNLSFADNQKLDSFIDHFLRDTNIYQDILKAMSLADDFDVKKLKEQMIDLINKIYLNSNYKFDKSIITIYEYDDYIKAYNAFFDESSAIHQDIYKHLDNLKQLDSLWANKQSLTVSDFVNNITDNLPFINFDGRAFHNPSACPQAKEAYLFFKDLKASLKETKDLYKALCIKYIDQLYYQWQMEKKNQKIQSFNDMIRNVRETILSNPAFLNKIKNKYDYAIIDEFQDTNKLQWDIFKNIFLTDNNHNIIVVGDPKQSIYSFQGADLFAYENAKKEIIDNDGLLCSLNKNFRSSANIVEACNEFFSLDYFSNKDSIQINFIPSLHIEKTDTKKEEMATYLGEDIKPFWIAGSASNPVNEYDFAKIAAEQIIDLCTMVNGKTKLQITENGNFRNVTFKDFAILCRTSSEMSPIESVFKQIGIPYLRYKDDSLFKGMECAHWNALLECLCLEDYTGINRNKFRKALFTKFFNRTLTEISNPYYDLDDIPEIKLLNKWKQAISCNAYEDLVDSIMIDSGLVDRMSNSQDIQSLSAFRQLGDYIVEYLSNNHTIFELTRHFNILLKGEKDMDGTSDDASIIGIGTNFDCVQLMTIHASKGLEFPVVIFASSFKAKNSRIKSSIFHKDQQQMVTFDNSLAKAEWFEEVKRLYYVGYTRPKYLLIIPRYDEINMFFYKPILDEFIKTKVDYYKPLQKSSKTYQILNKNVNLILQKEDDNLDDKGAQDNILNDLIKKSNSLKSYMHSYSSITHGTIDSITVDDEQEDKEGIADVGLAKFDQNGILVLGKYDNSISPLEFSSDYPKGARLGTALHEVFENLNFTDYNKNLEVIISNSFVKQGFRVKDEWIDDTKQVVERVLNALLPSVIGNKIGNSYFKLSSISSENKLSEVEFNFNLFGEHLKKYCNGYIDLVFRRGEVYSILDWKSDRLDEEEFTSFSDSASLNRHTSSSYAIQRVLYSYCLIKWLSKIYNESLEDTFNNHFGGIYYVYLRGCASDTSNGVFVKTWNSFNELEDAFSNILNIIGGKNNE